MWAIYSLSRLANNTPQIVRFNCGADFEGPFKCYVTQMGVGGVSDFLVKSVTKV